MRVKSSPQATAKSKQWRRDYLHPTILKWQQGMWGTAAGTKDQPQLCTHPWNLQILTGSFLWHETQGNSSQRAAASWRAGTSQRWTPCPTQTRSMCAIKGSSPHPGSGLCPHGTLTFTNLPPGKTGTFCLCWVFKLWCLVCVFLKESMTCF